MSPVNKVRVKKDENERVSEVYIYALTVLDYIELYKKFTYHTEESYSLQYIGTKIVGEGKTEYDGSINTIYKTDWNKTRNGFKGISVWPDKQQGSANQRAKDENGRGIHH